MLFFLHIAGFVALGLCLLGDDVSRWAIAAAFEEGVIVIVPLTLASLASGWADMVAISLHKVKKTHYISALAGAAAVIDVLLNIALIPRFGILGAAYTTLASQLARAIACAWLAQREFPIPFDRRRAAGVALVLGGAFALGQLTAPIGPILSPALEALLIAVAGVALVRLLPAR
jgi:O-antigen/teichoic acid export membrane protein